MENIVDIASKYTTLKPQYSHKYILFGAKRLIGMVGLCPFHKERTPSFTVHIGRQTFHCFGCGRGGSVEEFKRMVRLLDTQPVDETGAPRSAK